MNKIVKGFASDNNSGVHPDILKSISRVNAGHVIAYGDDPYTASALKVMKQHFGNEAEIFLVFNGTGANVLSFKAISHSFNSIICAETAHINVDECGAPEKFTGCKLLSIPTSNGKITVDQIRKYMHGIGFEHHSQPKIISITQATEVGTVYTVEEIKKLAEYAHRNQLFLHMDGARLCNAAVSLGTGLYDISGGAGVDVLSFGITKNGAMMGESVIFFNKKLTAEFKYYRKQAMQLGSKMRYMAVQFETLLQNDLWKKNAQHANKMAQLLKEKLQKIPQVKITQNVDTNGVFAIIPPNSIKKIQDKYFFYIWNEERSEVRWMTSFDTTEADIVDFVKVIENNVI
jgi:threonine aldolase